MKHGKVLLVALAVLTIVGLLPTATSAQSTLTGAVSDNTGGVMPGVTVEVSSPVLIEGSRIAVTDGTGRYTIIDLRPGTYDVTFSLPGFSTVLRQAVEIPANFTQTINTVLVVGGIAETVTVSGESPVVDVQNAARTEVLTRDLIDSLPTPRNTQSIGYLAQGVRLSRPDVGGAAMMENTQMYSHGASSVHAIMQIDGMMVNSQMGDGATMNYNNQALAQEMSISTSANPAEISAGGLRLNMIPKDGGNTVSGSFYGGFTDGSWQADNLDDKLRARGLTSVDGVSNIHDVNPSLGGPIFRDKLWYFVSTRAISVDELRANVELPGGEQAIMEQYVRSALVRLTAQVSQQNKVSVHMDRIFKFKGRDFTFGGRADAGLVAPRPGPRELPHVPGEVDVGHQQPRAARGRLLAGLRAAAPRLPAEQADQRGRRGPADRRAGSEQPDHLHPDALLPPAELRPDRRVVHQHRAQRLHPASADQCLYQRETLVFAGRSVLPERRLLVCDRLAHLQGRHAVVLRQRWSRIQPEWSHYSRVSGRRPGPGVGPERPDHLQHEHHT